MESSSLFDRRLPGLLPYAGSGSGVMGNLGQAAYAASTTFLDSFCAYRQQLGLPASVIENEIVKEVDYVAENLHRVPAC